MLSAFIALIPLPKALQQESFIDQNVFIYSFFSTILNRPNQLLRSSDIRMILHTLVKVKRVLRHVKVTENEKEKAIVDSLFDGGEMIKRNEFIGTMASLMVAKETDKMEFVKSVFTNCD